MRMNEILSRKGIEITEANYPAKDGEHRCGIIRKEMRIYSPSDWNNAKYSIVGVEIDTFEKTIRVQFLIGSMPYAKNLFWALLADRDVRRLISEYQLEGRTKKYKIWEITGTSGCKGIFITTGKAIGNFAMTKTKHLCYISQFGRLNAGFGDKKSKMYIGDFVELVAFMGLTDDMNVKSLRKRANVKYIRPKFAEEIKNFRTEVSKIL